MSATDLGHGSEREAEVWEGDDAALQRRFLSMPGTHGGPAASRGGGRQQHKWLMARETALSRVLAKAGAHAASARGEKRGGGLSSLGGLSRGLGGGSGGDRSSTGARGGRNPRAAPPKATPPKATASRPTADAPGAATVDSSGAGAPQNAQQQAARAEAIKAALRKQANHFKYFEREQRRLGQTSDWAED